MSDVTQFDPLAQLDARKAEVVKLRMFVGLEVKEITAVFDTSEKTVQRDWMFARAWLSRESKTGAPTPSSPTGGSK